MMLAKTYAAFKAAGVSEAEAQAAAELGRIEADLAVIKWMIGGLFVIVGGVGLPGVWLVLRIAAKVGALS